MNERQGREPYGESARRSTLVCVREKEKHEKKRREERERKSEREEERSEKRGACHGRLNDDSKVDGFLGPFYIEIQRSA